MKFFAILFLFCLLNGAYAQESVKITVQEKTRQAQIVSKQIDGQETQGLLVYAQNAWYKIYFSKDAVQLISQAAQRYYSEFEAMKLKKGKKDTQKKYGSFQTFVEWGSDKKFIDRYSDAKADVGYVFVKAAPYFSVSVDSVQNKNPEQTGPAYQSSGQITLLFTKAQIADLLGKLSKN